MKALTNTLAVDLGNSHGTASSLEVFRFKVVTKNYLRAQVAEREELFNELSKYIRFSTISSEIINEFISCCVAENVADRIEAGVDILSQFGDKICDYAWQFLVQDVTNHHATYSERAYRPDDEYWHILLKSVAGSTAEASRKVKIIGACKGAATRSMKEIIIESLDEVDDQVAINLIEGFLTDDDEFIRRLASDILS